MLPIGPAAANFPHIVVWRVSCASHSRRPPPRNQSCIRSPAALSSALRACAGEYPAEVEWPVSLMCPVSRLCAASTPLAVELFCGGALGMLLRIAQRWVAAQPRGARDGSLAMFRDGLVFPMNAFGRVVWEARAHLPLCLCPRPAAQNSLPVPAVSLLVMRRLNAPLSAQVGVTNTLMSSEVRALHAMLALSLPAAPGPQRAERSAQGIRA